MSNDEDKAGSKSPMPSDEETNTEEQEYDVKELRRLYNNVRQREWAERNRERSRELKKESYRKHNPAKQPKYMEVGLLEMMKSGESVAGKKRKYLEVGLEEMKRKEEAAAAKAKSDKYPPDNEDCAGECDVNSCWDCRQFYHEGSIEEHPWFAKHGLAQPEKLPSEYSEEYGLWREREHRCDWIHDLAMDGTVGWTDNTIRKHPVLMLLMEAYDFVALAEPVEAASGPVAGAQMLPIAEAMELACSPLCRARPRGRFWVLFCNGKWTSHVDCGGYGFCKRCSVVAPRTQLREAVQEAAEVRLYEDMKTQWEAWLRSYGWLGDNGGYRCERYKGENGPAQAAWRRQWRLVLEERVQKRAAAGVIACK
jgi:hypothetical protein